MIHVYHGDGKGKTTAAMGLALRMLAAGRRVVVVQFLKDGESGEARLLAGHFGVPVFAGKVSDKFTWSMTPEELAATCELHDGNLASALAELEGAQEGLLVLDEALDALSKGLVDEALVDRALDMSARGVVPAFSFVGGLIPASAVNHFYWFATGCREYFRNRAIDRSDRKAPSGSF